MPFQFNSSDAHSCLRNEYAAHIRVGCCIENNSLRLVNSTSGKVHPLAVHPLKRDYDATLLAGLRKRQYILKIPAR